MNPIIYTIAGKVIQGASILGGIYLGVEQKNWELGTILGIGAYVVGYFVGELGYKAEDELEKKVNSLDNKLTELKNKNNKDSN